MEYLSNEPHKSEKPEYSTNQTPVEISLRRGSATIHLIRNAPPQQSIPAADGPFAADNRQWESCSRPVVRAMLEWWMWLIIDRSAGLCPLLRLYSWASGWI